MLPTLAVGARRQGHDDPGSEQFTLSLTHSEERAFGVQNPKGPCRAPTRKPDRGARREP